MFLFKKNWRSSVENYYIKMRLNALCYLNLNKQIDYNFLFLCHIQNLTFYMLLFFDLYVLFLYVYYIIFLHLHLIF